MQLNDTLDFINIFIGPSSQVNEVADDCSREGVACVITKSGITGEQTIMNPIVKESHTSTDPQLNESTAKPPLPPIRFTGDDHHISPPSHGSGEAPQEHTETLPEPALHSSPSEMNSTSASKHTCADTTPTTTDTHTEPPTTTLYLEKSAETESMTATFNDSAVAATNTVAQQQTTTDGDGGDEKTTSTVEHLPETRPDVDATTALSQNNAKYTSLVMITQDKKPAQVNVVTSDMTRFVSSSSRTAAAAAASSSSPENPSIVVRHTNWEEADTSSSADNSLAGYFTHALATDDEEQQQSASSGTLERRRTVKITSNVDYVAATGGNNSDVSGKSCKSEVESIGIGSDGGGGVGCGGSQTTSLSKLNSKMCLSGDESDDKSPVPTGKCVKKSNDASICVGGDVIVEGGRSGGEDDVTVVTGANTLSAVVIGVHEDGLADDDSWVDESSLADEDGGAEDAKLMEEDFGSSETDSDLDYNDGATPLMCTAVDDREADLRGYNRTAIDFTLHTIVEESCEESEVEPSMPSHSKNNKSRMSASELEKYFFFGIGGDHQNQRQFNSYESTATGRGEESMSETSSVVSEDMDSLNGPESHHNDMAADLASSRLEKYFLSGFMGFSGERNDSDGSGSVGSDSEGRPSPEQRRKKLVRARGSGRSHSNSLDNLLSGKEDENPAAAESSSAIHEANDSSETDTCDETIINLDKSENLSDTLKRKKQQLKKGRFDSEADKRDQQQSQLSDPSDEDGKKTPQPEYLLAPGSSSASSSLVHSRKQHSRDSGFIGSNDDLLQNGESSAKTPELRLELAEIEEENKIDVQRDSESQAVAGSSTQTTPQSTLCRKDSFNNWSSDEETNVMMSRMRQFFKTLVAASANASSVQSSSSIAASKSSTPNVSGANTPKNGTPVPRARHRSKPPQLVYFENELTRLMKTVPGINDDQVREIVEYLSSEDTWSDSYDSSDYTSSDLEGAAPYKLELQQQISASCQQIINKFDKIEHDEEGDIGDGGLVFPEAVVAQRANSAQGMNETAVVYQRLMASLSKYTKADEKPVPEPVNSPPLFAKVMQHIGTRLVALMHEVSSGDSHASSSSPRSANRYQRRLQAKISATTTEDDDSTNESKEHATGTILNLPRSKSHDLLLGDPKPLHHMSSSGVSDTVNEEKESDYERFSWRGSFESALLADSRSKLSVLDHTSSVTSLAAKRRSAGDLLFNQKSMSREQLDRVRSCGSIGGVDHDESKLWESENSTGNRRRSSATEAVCNSDNASTSEEENKIQNRSTLPRSLQSNAAVTSSSTNSLPRLSTSNLASAAIQKSQSVYQFLQNNVKSARYRAPGFSRPSSSASSSTPSPGSTSQMNKKSLSVPGLSQNVVPARRNRKNQNNFSCGELEFSFLEELLRSFFRGGGYTVIFTTSLELLLLLLLCLLNRDFYVIINTRWLVVVRSRISLQFKELQVSQ